MLARGEREREMGKKTHSESRAEEINCFWMKVAWLCLKRGAASQPAEDRKLKSPNGKMCI